MTDLPDEFQKLLGLKEYTPIEIFDQQTSTITRDIELLGEYVNSVDSSFKNAAKKVLEEYGPFVGEFDGPPDKYFQLEYEFPTMAWHGTFITLFSCIEYELKMLTMLVSKLLSPACPIKDKAYLNDFKSYLNDTHGIKMTFDLLPWAEINEHYKAIRNSIVHHRGDTWSIYYFEKEPKNLNPKDLDQWRIEKQRRDVDKLKAKADSLNGEREFDDRILIVEDIGIKLSKDFCAIVVNTAREFFTELVKECHDAISKAR